MKGEKKRFTKKTHTQNIDIIDVIKHVPKRVYIVDSTPIYRASLAQIFISLEFMTNALSCLQCVSLDVSAFCVDAIENK